MRGGATRKVQDQLALDVQHVCAAPSAFAALKADGSVVTWGNLESGGCCSKVQAQLAADVQHIYATGSAFAALKNGGMVVTWGEDNLGGDCSEVQTQLVDVQHICATGMAKHTCQAFAAL